jgi:hypothetical protein
MIKTAQDAYLAGRQAALIKLAAGEKDKTPPLAGNKAIMDALSSAGATANEIRQGIGLGGLGLSRNMMQDDNTDPDRLTDEEFNAAYLTDKPLRSALNPMNYATMENLSRAGMLAGAAGGTYLGGMDPRAAALASAGALGGGFAGGGLGMALGKGIDAYIGKAHGGLSDVAKQRLIAGGGALGGLGGGLGAGMYL